MQPSFLDEGFILDKKTGVGQPKRIANAKILVANTAMGIQLACSMIIPTAPAAYTFVHYTGMHHA